MSYQSIQDRPQDMGRVGFIGEPAPATPPFRFFCPIGCAPQTAAQCQGIVAQAIRDAIVLAERAAQRLEQRNAGALLLFGPIFGDPMRPVPWAGNRPAADLVAQRYRAVAAGFRNRVPHIRCSARNDVIAVVQPRAAPSAANPLPRNTILLGQPFWGPGPAGTATRFWRAATVLHEMLHLLFWEFFGHQANLPRPGDPEERRRDNSFCYEAFALRLAGQAAAAESAACAARPF
jgi:hypothetical protein